MIISHDMIMNLLTTCDLRVRLSHPLCRRRENRHTDRPWRLGHRSAIMHVCPAMSTPNAHRKLKSLCGVPSGLKLPTASVPCIQKHHPTNMIYQTRRAFPRAEYHGMVATCTPPRARGFARARAALVGPSCHLPRPPIGPYPPARTPPPQIDPPPQIRVPIRVLTAAKGEPQPPLAGART
jgi:hypothetical protein